MTTRRSLAPLIALAATLAAGPLAARCHADFVLATSYNNAAGFQAGNSIAPLAQQFTLNQESTIASIDADATANIGSTFSNLSMTIFSDNGANQIGSTNYGTSATPTGTLGGGPMGLSDLNFGFSGLTLQAGTYWMEFTTTGTGNILWARQDGTINNSSATGSINNHDSYSSFGSEQYFQTAFLTTINAPSPPAVPEPCSLTLMALGLIGSAAAIRRRRAALLDGPPGATGRTRPVL